MSKKCQKRPKNVKKIKKMTKKSLKMSKTSKNVKEDALLYATVLVPKQLIDDDDKIKISCC